MKTEFLVVLIFILSAEQSLKAQSAFNTGGATLKTDNINYAYSIGEVSGFSIQPDCIYTQGVIQPRYSCASLNYENNNLYAITVYPNPTSGILTIETDYSDFTIYKIFTAIGMLVQSSKFTYSPISIKNLSKGIYLLQLFSSDNSIKKSFKIIKQ